MPGSIYPVTWSKAEPFVYGGSNPAPGTSVQFALPDQFVHAVTGVSLSFTTSAAVANRAIQLTVLWQGFKVLRRFAVNPQGASLARDYWFGMFNPAEIVDQPGTTFMLPLPLGFLLPVATLVIGANLIDAADQFSAPVVTGVRIPLAVR